MDKSPDKKLIPGQAGIKPPALPNDSTGFDAALEHIDLDEAPIYLIRGQKVILDEDVARIYEVETRTLIRTVRREIQRFPVDFLFKLTGEEFKQLRDQAPDGMTFVRNKSTPYAFTEEGVLMAAQVLHSYKAIHMNIEIVRNFVRLSKLCGSDVDVSKKIEHLELKYDQQFQKLFKALESMQSGLKPPVERHIGFQVR